MQTWLDLDFGDGGACEWPPKRTVTPSVLFLTLTMPHDFGNDLASLFATQKAAWKHIFSGRPWRSDKKNFGVEHWIRAWDCTHGVNGWHPHAHAVLFCTRTPDEHELKILETRIYERWAEAVEERGYRRPTRANGVRLEMARTREDLARYVAQLAVCTEKDNECKIALEVARTDLKLGRKGRRTPFEILADFHATGDVDQLDLWHEWERATEGQKAIRWSNGLKALVAVIEREDDEIAAEEIGGETLVHFGDMQWVAICQVRGGQRRVLRAAESGGAAAVHVEVAIIEHEFHRQRKRREAA